MTLYTEHKKCPVDDRFTSHGATGTICMSMVDFYRDALGDTKATAPERPKYMKWPLQRQRRVALVALRSGTLKFNHRNPDTKVGVANMGPIWVLSAPGGPHVGPMNFAIREHDGVALWTRISDFVNNVTGTPRRLHLISILVVQRIITSDDSMQVSTSVRAWTLTCYSQNIIECFKLRWFGEPIYECFRRMDSACIPYFVNLFVLFYSS